MRNGRTLARLSNKRLEVDWEARKLYNSSMVNASQELASDAFWADAVPQRFAGMRLFGRVMLHGVDFEVEDAVVGNVASMAKYGYRLGEPLPDGALLEAPGSDESGVLHVIQRTLVEVNDRPAAVQRVRDEIRRSRVSAEKFDDLASLPMLVDTDPGAITYVLADEERRLRYVQQSAWYLRTGGIPGWLTGLTTARVRREETNAPKESELPDELITLCGLEAFKGWRQGGVVKRMAPGLTEYINLNGAVVLTPLVRHAGKAGSVRSTDPRAWPAVAPVRAHR